ncbi:SDR family NAD(P)-dependent oxidoreductase [Microbacterium terrisoli]|uniref:SDR family NAD(P)-dependent oxidoreductase n=1 Tax=Microbacterium terrisoli TaxID=3242192 RepID=UPI002804D49F|nr:SDR family oxidoreductase [Microbacterium protaetiae]
MTDLTGRTVLIAGATSASGHVAAQTLLDVGANVVAVGHDPGKLEQLAETLRAGTAAGADDPWMVEACDLADEDSVHSLAERLHTADIHVDGLLHLVGGWRGGGGLAGQTDDDYRFLEQSLTALRHVTRVFDDDLNASDAARLAFVSSVSVTNPLAGGANYAAVKAAGEAWMRAAGHGFAKNARDGERPLAAASVIFRVKSLSGLEQTLADRFVALWDADPADVNRTVIDLTA